MSSVVQLKDLSSVWWEGNVIAGLLQVWSGSFLILLKKYYISWLQTILSKSYLSILFLLLY